MPRALWLTSLLAVAVAVATSGCKTKTDLGQPCKMTRPPAAGQTCSGQTTCPIDPKDIADPKLDYVALGSAECDDLVCLRSAGSENPEPPAGETGVAYGYCTASCIDAQNCEYDYNGNKNALSCERLLLSSDFLAKLQQQNPQTFAAVFGSGASSKYCIKPRLTTP